MEIEMIIDIVMACFIGLQFIIIICLIVGLSKLKKRFNSFLPKNENLDMEKMLVEYSEKVFKTLEKEQEMVAKMEQSKEFLIKEIENNKKLLYLTNEKLKNTTQKVAMVRYNPFEEVGGDFCYALAFLDDHNNGVLITSIYSREGCYSYAKEITNGESRNHKLGEEEQQALTLAMNK